MKKIILMTLAIASTLIHGQGTDSNSNIKLCTVLIEDKLAEVTKLLHQGANVNCSTSEGLRPVTIAVIKGNENMVKQLIQKGADLDVFDNYMRTPLMYASHLKLLKIAETLLAAGADINAREREDSPTALTEAIYERSEAMTKFLISKNADVNQNGDGGYTPLCAAAATGQLEIVKLLISSKADVNAACSNTGRTPLIIAAGYGQAEIVSYLISKRADINAQDSEGRSALSWAKDTGEEECIEILQKKRAK